MGKATELYSLSEDKIADILMQKYSLLKQEIWLSLGFYKSHIRNFQILSGSLLALAGFVLSKPELYPNQNNWLLWWPIITIIPIISNYLIMDIIESQYTLSLLGERLEMIEKKINEISGQRLLIYQKEIVPGFFYRFKPLHGIINPLYFLSGQAHNSLWGSGKRNRRKITWDMEL